MSSEARQAAKESVQAAYGVIDRIGDYIQAEAGLMAYWNTKPWEEKVEHLIDKFGWEIPEMYETLIHLAQAIELLTQEEP